MLNIIGGVFKGRKIKAPPGDKTRPTSNMLRKAVFDICQNHIVDARFLDLFAGSGAMGLEALSRGASHATFIDLDKTAFKVIQENITSLKAEKQAEVMLGDVLICLKRLHQAKRQFNIIYIDPPYNRASIIAEILLFLDQHSLLLPEALVFAEEASPSSFLTEPLPLLHLSLKDSRSFGKSLLHQYRLV